MGTPRLLQFFGVRLEFGPKGRQEPHLPLAAETPIPPGVGREREKDPEHNDSNFEPGSLQPTHDARRAGFVQECLPAKSGEGWDPRK